jgi:hypothetical protein
MHSRSAADKLVDDRSEKQCQANHGGDDIIPQTPETDQCFQYGKHHRPENNPDSRSFTAAEATSTQHGSQDGVQFQPCTGAIRLNC